MNILRMSVFASALLLPVYAQPGACTGVAEANCISTRCDWSSSAGGTGACQETACYGHGTDQTACEAATDCVFAADGRCYRSSAATTCVGFTTDTTCNAQTTCSWDTTGNVCLVSGTFATCANQDGNPQACVDSSSCDYQATENKCTPLNCVFMRTKANCDTAKHCTIATSHVNAIGCMAKSTREAANCPDFPLKTCGSVQICGRDRSDTSKCITCSSVTNQNDCNQSPGCHYESNACQAVGLVCTQQTTEASCLQQGCVYQGTTCTFSRSATDCSALSGTTPTTTCTAKKGCTLSGTTCTYSTNVDCSSLPKKDCLGHEQCFYEDQTRTCYSAPTCSKYSTESTCSGASGGNTCTPIMIAVQPFAPSYTPIIYCDRMKSSCGSLTNQTSCDNDARCLWVSTSATAFACKPFMGCRILTQAQCGSKNSSHTCVWSTSRGQCVNGGTGCRQMNMQNDVCGGSSCTGIIDTWKRSIDFYRQETSGAMGIDLGLERVFPVHAGTDQPLCGQTPGSFCYPCAGGYTVNPYVKMTCNNNGLEFNSQLCVLEADVCTDTYEACVRQSDETTPTPASASALAPFLTLLVLVALL